MNELIRQHQQFLKGGLQLMAKVTQQTIVKMFSTYVDQDANAIEMFTSYLENVFSDSTLKTYMYMQAYAAFIDEDEDSLDTWEDIDDRPGMFNLCVISIGVTVYLPIADELIAMYEFKSDYAYDVLAHLKTYIKLYQLGTGCYGINKEHSWLRNHIEKKMFTFGCIEYEPKHPLPAYLTRDVKNWIGSGMFIQLHWTKNDKIILPEVKKSIEDAHKFFKQCFGTYPRAYGASSWFWNPQWKKYIPDSRLGHASDIFEILPPRRFNTKHPAPIYWIYGRWDVDPRDYPADTTLKRLLCDLYNRNELPVAGVCIVRTDGPTVLWQDQH